MFDPNCFPKWFFYDSFIDCYSLVCRQHLHPCLSFSHFLLYMQVKHSRTSCRSSYDKDFHELIDTYTSKGMAATRKPGTNVHDSEHESDSSDGSANGSMSDADDMYPSDSENSDSEQIYGNGSKGSTANKKAPAVSKKNILSVEFLEDELDICDSVDDLDGNCLLIFYHLACLFFLVLHSLPLYLGQESHGYRPRPVHVQIQNRCP